MKTIFCKKLKENLKQLDKTPLKGEIGQEIYENISEKAWGLWLEKQTMLINENKLSLIDKSTKIFLRSEMKKFLDLT